MRIDEKRQGETGRDYAFRILKENIIYRELIPGSMISEKEIADLLGLSRTPVREALIELSKSGIVEVLPQRGCQVSFIDYAKVEEACFIRAVLEKAVIELACDMATQEDIKELSDNVLLQEFYLEHFDHVKIMELDNNFHKKFFTLTGKLQCYQLMSGINIHFDRVRDISLLSTKDIKIVEDHRKLLEAVKSRNKEIAQKQMEAHLKRFKLDEQIIKEKYPEFIK